MASPVEITAEMPPQVHSAAEAERLGEPIADQYGRLTSADGTGLFYRYWPATATRTGQAVIVLHGIGYHSGPYKVIANALNPCGIDVYGLDARGHGLSLGKRGYLGSPANVEADVVAMVELVKNQHSGTRVFLLGDSMGCNYALNYSRENHGHLAGLILLAPAFFVDSRQLLGFESFLLMPFFVLAHRRPVISLTGERLAQSSRDPQWIAARRADPLAYKKVSFGYLLDILRLIKGWKATIALKVTTPILMIKGGNDHVVSQRDCETFERLSASRDKRFEMFPEMAHTTLWDPETPGVLTLVSEWTLAH
jgi:alpha-beta hydrolase superfamily lysophospholipase